jgi:hypothetical protein
VKSVQVGVKGRICISKIGLLLSRRSYLICAYATNDAIRRSGEVLYTRGRGLSKCNSKAKTLLGRSDECP